MASKYIDNKKFYDEIVIYRKKKDAAILSGQPEPKMPDYLGECLILLANNFASKPRFAGYTYRDEMVDDAIENCILYFDKFDYEKYNNPFAYYTQIIYFAFYRRIGKEKKQEYIRSKMVDRMITELQIEGDYDTINALKADVDEHKIDVLYKNFENEEKKQKKIKHGSNTLINFIFDEDEDND